MSTPSFRVYFVTHHNGCLTGHLMRAFREPFDPPPPSAYGLTEEDVLQQLMVQLMAAEASGEDDRVKYRWTEPFEMGTARIVVHPETAVGTRRVIGKREVPLRLSYAWAETKQGGYRVMLPRFDWWFVAEVLDIVDEILSTAVAGALAGEKGRWLYEFRSEGPEYVKTWSPTGSGKRAPVDEQDPFLGFPTLSQVADELLQQARRRRLPPAVGRHDVFLPYRDLLFAPVPVPLLIVGRPGVGKTTWIQRLARYLLSEERRKQTVPRLFFTNRDRIVAGQVYLGMWQARCLELVRELAYEGHYLVVERLADLVRPMPDGTSMADIFEEPLHAEQLSLMAEATEEEFELLRKRRPALLDAFHIVRLAEPPPRDVPQLLMRYLEQRNATERILNDGLVRLVRHLDDFEPSRGFPGKAFRAAQWFLEEGKAAGSLDGHAVSGLYSRYSGLPHDLLADEYPLGPDAIAQRLEARVIGQPVACRVASELIARLKAGLHDPERPVGSLFFVGPTGVGKTELAKQIAAFLFGAGKDGADARLIRLDMSEYMLPGSAQRLLSAESSGTGSLAQRIRQQPLSVVLLDEIEKAHAEVFDLLLAVLGEGRMTDTRGRLVDFRMVVFVMTSNLGVSERAPVGFGSDGAEGYLAQVRDHFRPEFFGRLDRVVSFSALTPKDVGRIVDILLKELAERTGFRQRNLRLRITQKARERLAALGYHPTRGARPLKRVVESRVVTPLAVRIVEHPDLHNQDVWVIADETPPVRAVYLQI